VTGSGIGVAVAAAVSVGDGVAVAVAVAVGVGDGSGVTVTVAVSVGDGSDVVVATVAVAVGAMVGGPAGRVDLPRNSKITIMTINIRLTMSLIKS